MEQLDGGGGLYGGGGGDMGSGGGGSGYLGSGVKNGCMYIYKRNQTQTSTAAATKTIATTNVSETAKSNYVKSGDGYARITLVE